MEAPMTPNRPDPIQSAALNPSAEMRGIDSANDSLGGQQVPSGRPNPDPIEELATIGGDSQDNWPDRPHLANQPGPKPGFGPNPTAEKLVGNPDLGIDPREAAETWQNGPKRPYASLGA
jgi:hypothetical protein